MQRTEVEGLSQRIVTLGPMEEEYENEAVVTMQRLDGMQRWDRACPQMRSLTGEHGLMAANLGTERERLSPSAMRGMKSWRCRGRTAPERFQASVLSPGPHNHSQRGDVENRRSSIAARRGFSTFSRARLSLVIVK